MTNFELPNLPLRTQKGRNHGLTLVNDSGFSLHKVQSIITTAEPVVDLIKFSVSAALVDPHFRDKIRSYRIANMRPFFSGTVFEVFVARNMFEEYCSFVLENDIHVVEVSTRNTKIDHNKKCDYIRKFVDLGFIVISQICTNTVASSTSLSFRHWNSMIEKELEAGSWKVSLETHKSDYYGIDFKANYKLMELIKDHVDINDVIWESPSQKQQAWFISQLGANVNLGDIISSQVNTLECMRMGLDDETFKVQPHS